MIPFRHTDERVWRATHVLQYDRLDPAKYVAHVDPALWADLRRTAVTDFPALAVGWDGVTWRIFGLPIVVDPRLRRGEIVLRHEVEA